ncbi:hypothetical protein C5167_008468 [Papaver somniferum]|uniref:Uncharacterized protein n=1 Tax=Papaver somniferum TaxID=3469 RepID=A0A4Y7JUL8_PAPSO|nr:hypothetical protein C5167_008468 [Papaver somniferum]
MELSSEMDRVVGLDGSETRSWSTGGCMESRNFDAGSLDTEKSLRLCSCGLLEVMSITLPSKEWMDAPRQSAQFLHYEGQIDYTTRKIRRGGSSTLLSVPAMARDNNY